ncbi:MAG: Gfo/Idh/MocA family oxidoreductase [Planctomycetota bacterium]|nr:Gfo/Idh/MocA family oxidoreductase [Planctomycetota bacterium]
MSSLRVGLLGAGDVAERHVRGLLSAGSVALVAVYDPATGRAETLGGRLGFERTAADARQVIDADDVDLVLVLTPHHLHAEQSMAALRAGKHVICEKPMACRVEECDAMLECAAACGRRLFVSHALRCDFFFRVALERLREGALGRLTLGSIRWFTDEFARLETPGHWKGTTERSGGGVLIDGGCHVADLANALFGRPLRVHAMGGLLVASREGLGEDTAVFSVEFASGAVCSFALSFVAGSAMREERFACGMDVDLYGTEAHLGGGYRIRDDVVRRYAREHRQGEPERIHVDDGRTEAGEVDARIVEALRTGEEPPVTALEARNALAVVEAAYRSLRSGAAEDVDWRQSSVATDRGD